MPYMIQAPPDLTMRYWVSRLMREAREAAGVRRTTVADRLLVSEHTIMRFETCQSYPKAIDQYMVAYADAIAVRTGETIDPREFHGLALEQWMREGEPPRIEVDEGPEPTPVSLAVSAAQTARRETQTSANGSRPGPAAKARRSPGARSSR